MAPRLLFLSICVYAFAVSATFFDAKTFAVSANCNSDSKPCGSAVSCCPSGFECNFRRGIPICSNPNETSLSGYDYVPCADPYTIRCDDVLGIATGSCCPIGSICRIHGNSQAVECINAFGETQSAIPSATTATTAFVPSRTATTNDTVYSPPHAWNTLTSEYNCTTSKHLYMTSTINATVTINYTGPTITINLVTSPNGGVFSVIVDGFNTTSKIDTFSALEDAVLPMPTCFPVQFPPFEEVPPDFGSKNQHTMSLVFIGASSDAPEGTKSNLQIDSFSIPNYDNLASSQVKSNDSGTIMRTMGFRPLTTVILGLLVLLDRIL